MIVVPYTFQCKELLFVLARMHPPTSRSEEGTIRDAAAQLANTLLRNVEIVDDHELLVVLDEPVEAVAIARDFEMRLERCIASPLAVEMLSESGQPAHESFTWLQKQLLIPADPNGALLKVKGLGRDRLPAGIDQIPDGPGVWLWIITPNGDRVTFIARQQTLGTHADISIDDRLLARVHAAIIPYRGTWAIEDRASPSGTFVDNSRCRSRCLVPGMTIQIGYTQMLVLSVR